METVKVNTSQHIDIDYPVAGLGERTAAHLIDLGIFFGFCFIVWVIMLLTDLAQSNLFTGITFIIIWAAGFVFYDLLCEIFMNGQSIGKRLLKIKVISLNGAQPSLGQYFIRWLFRIVDFSPLTVFVGGFLAVAVTDNKQRVGDLVAGTTLIKTVPRTKFEHIAFHPVSEEYQPVFDSVNKMSDHDIELIHEVISTYYKTFKHDLVYQMSARVVTHLGVTIPTGMNELEFLKTVVMDYNHITSRS
jgi:uncharacterized RDD family membrane protein YckC